MKNYLSQGLVISTALLSSYANSLGQTPPSQLPGPVLPRMQRFSYNAQEVDAFIRKSIEVENLGTFTTPEERLVRQRQATEALQRYEKGKQCEISLVPVPNEQKIYVMYRAQRKLGELYFKDGKPYLLQLHVKDMDPKMASIEETTGNTADAAKEVVGEGLGVVHGVIKKLERARPSRSW